MIDYFLLYPRGAFRLQDVAQSGTRDSLDIIDKVLTTAQPDDGCLIQFTSVSR